MGHGAWGMGHGSHTRVTPLECPLLLPHVVNGASQLGAGTAPKGGALHRVAEGRNGSCRPSNAVREEVREAQLISGQIAEQVKFLLGPLPPNQTHALLAHRLQRLPLAAVGGGDARPERALTLRGRGRRRGRGRGRRHGRGRGQGRGRRRGRCCCRRCCCLALCEHRRKHHAPIVQCPRPRDRSGRGRGRGRRGRGVCQKHSGLSLHTRMR